MSLFLHYYIKPMVLPITMQHVDSFFINVILYGQGSILKLISLYTAIIICVGFFLIGVWKKCLYSLFFIFYLFLNYIILHCYFFLFCIL